MHSFVCKQCGGPFTHIEKRRTFCSQDCFKDYQRAINVHTLQFLEARIERVPIGGCWLWTAGTDANGYGRVHKRLAHRLSWILHNGPIHDNLHVLHRCDNPPCVNPAHLFLGTQRDNTADRHAKGRTRVGIGERSGAARLTVEQVLAIRNDRRSSLVLAKVYGVGKTTIQSVKNRETWRHV